MASVILEHSTFRPLIAFDTWGLFHSKLGSSLRLLIIDTRSIVGGRAERLWRTLVSVHLGAIQSVDVSFSGKNRQGFRGICLFHFLLPPRLHSKQVLEDDRWNENEDGVGHKEQGAEHVIEPSGASIIHLHAAENDERQVIHDHHQTKQLHHESFLALASRTDSQIEAEQREPQASKVGLQGHCQDPREDR